MTRIGQNRSCAECARAEFHPPLKPSKYLAVGEHLGCYRRGVCGASSAQLIRLKGLIDLFIRACRTQMGRASLVGGEFPPIVHARSQKCAEANPIVARSRLDKDMVPQTRGGDLSVR